MTIEIHRSKNRKEYPFYFKIKGRNGQTLVTSEIYERKAGCKTGINALLKGFAGEVKIIDKTIALVVPVKKK